MEKDGFTVAIVSDQPVARVGMEELVSDEPTLTVATTVESVDELAAGAGHYHVVILDLPSRAPEATADLVARVARIGRPVVCSSWAEPSTLLAAIRAGARACITWHTEQPAVREALRTAAHGGFYLCARLVDPFQDELAKPPADNPNGLAPHEIETLRWIALGLTHAQTATRMGLSHSTVNTYAKRIHAKLKVTNKAELTRMAIELGHVSQSRHTYPAA